jgi:hypothetical protein
VSFVAITLCVVSQRVFIVVSVYFVIDAVRKLLDTPSYVFPLNCFEQTRNLKKLSMNIMPLVATQPLYV